MYCCQQSEEKAALLRWRPVFLVGSLQSSVLFETCRRLMAMNARRNVATGPPVSHGSWWPHISDRLMREEGGSCPFLYILVSFWKFGNRTLGPQRPKLTVWDEEMKETRLYSGLHTHNFEKGHFQHTAFQRLERKKPIVNSLWWSVFVLCNENIWWLLPICHLECNYCKLVSGQRGISVFFNSHWEGISSFCHKDN